MLISSFKSRKQYKNVCGFFITNIVAAAQWHFSINYYNVHDYTQLTGK
ncbi:hypothetical protein GA0116948_11370 [Chitinophaga costaii]|uniref:Uncharacterized protein n=1 Tax=Chitinophaga costaii TaxID=1335309 RepID=A0A1C4FDK1_9BACT|nr:hypothetical protein GA0116948_11370 [Chitinophaga costaii]